VRLRTGRDTSGCSPSRSSGADFGDLGGLFAILALRQKRINKCSLVASFSRVYCRRNDIAAASLGSCEVKMVEILDENKDDRKSRLTEALDDMILKIMINLNQRGYGTSEILDALDDVCERRWHAYEEDPDPADDP
jgi:hypothetical protein